MTLALTLPEQQSSALAKLKEHVESRIDLLRKKNDSALDETETATIRGGIRELKNLLAQVDPQPVPVTVEADV